MAQASFGQLVDPQEEAIQRQRQYAQALRQQAMQPMEQQVVSGRVVPFSITQGLANMLKAYAGRKGEEEADTKAMELGTRKRTQGAAELQGIVEALRGKPAIPSFQTGANEMGDESVMQNPVAAQAPDQNKALAMALASQNPMAQQIGGTLLTASLPKAPKMERVEVPDGKGGKRVGFVDMNSPNPFSTFQEGGVDPAKGIAVNGQIVNPTQMGQTIPKQLDPTDPRRDLLVPGPDGQLVPNAPLVGVKQGIAKAGKPDIRVDARNYNTQESEQSKVYGKGLGEVRVQINQAGYDAPKKLAQLDRMESLLAGIDGGAAAPALAEMASFAQSFGIKLDPKLGPKEAAQAIAREMAGGLRQPGTGPMTDKDFDNFLKQVPDLSKTGEGRAQIMKTMRAAIERDQRAAQFAREYAKKNGGVIDDNFFDAVAGFYAQNPVVTPQMPATNARGNAFNDPGKEQRYQEWLKGKNK